MTSDRHLNLMALMRDIEEPSKTYRRSVRLAASTETDSPANLAAIERGNAALDDIERAVRAWVAAHPEPAIAPSKDTPLSDYDFVELVAFASKVENEGFGYAFEEYPPHFEAPELAPIATDFGLLRRLYDAWEEALDEFWSRSDAEDVYDAHIDEAHRRRREERDAAAAASGGGR